MARTKFKNITMEYAGADLLAGGMLANVDGALSGATRYNVQAVQCLGAAAVELDENGNLERECSVSVAVDYETEADMLADVLTRRGFADGHQRGVLKWMIEAEDEEAEDVVMASAAALSGFNYSSTLGGRGLRVVFEYSFILGADAGV